jgi:hypothetical protein
MRNKTKTEGSMELRLYDDHTIETVGVGYVTGAVLARTRAALEQAVGARRVRYWLADATQVSGFSGDVGTEGAGLLSDFKSLGGAEIIATLPNPAVRMIVVSVAFAAGVPLKVFAERGESASYHASRRRA